MVTAALSPASLPIPNRRVPGVLAGFPGDRPRLLFPGKMASRPKPWEWGRSRSLASTLLLFLLTCWFLVSTLTAGQTMLAESGSQAFMEIYRGWGFEGQLDRWKSITWKWWRCSAISCRLPSFWESIFATFINFSVARLVLGKLGRMYPAYRPLLPGSSPAISLQVPGGGYSFVLGEKLLWPKPALEIGLNIQVIFNLVLALAGLTVVHHLLRRYSLPKALIILASGIIILNPIFLQLVTLLGIIDIAFNLRRL